MKINYDELMNFNEIEIKEDTSKIDEIIEYQEILLEISKSLKKYREENRLTQKQLAKLLEIDQVMISKLESGNYNPTFKQLHKISRKLTNSAEFLINVLDNIVDNLNQMYKTTYEVTIKKEKYNSFKEASNVIYMSDFKCDLQGGNYETEKCTSTISIAG